MACHRGQEPYDAALRAALPLFAAVVLGVFAAGCTSRHSQTVGFLHSHETEVSTGHYVLRPPDRVAIHAPGIEEVDGTTAQLRPDGKIVLRLLGEVDVAGLTTEEVAAKLRSLLKRYYLEPEVVVEINNYRSQFYYVFGEVASPGPKPYTGRDTLVKALAEAQPTYLAWRAQIRVIRPAAQPGQSQTLIIDLDKMVQNGDMSQDVLLQDGDVIQVPPTPLAWVGHRFRELLYPVSPVLQAYEGPAGAIEATDIYRGDDDDDRD